MSESFVLGTAQDREDLHRERCQRVDTLKGELEALEEGLPTFVGEAGSALLHAAVSAFLGDRRFADKQVNALLSLATHQERIEDIEAELEGLQ